MLKSIKTTIDCLIWILSGRAGGAAQRFEDWNCDPLSHPDLKRMSLQALADLPFDPAAFRDCSN